MGTYKENIPKADMLMGSMRSMGYSFESAIADVIDNSISAGCSFVSILFPTDPCGKSGFGRILRKIDCRTADAGILSPGGACEYFGRRQTGMACAEQPFE